MTATSSVDHRDKDLGIDPVHASLIIDKEGREEIEIIRSKQHPKK